MSIRWYDLKERIIETLGLVDRDLPAVVIGTAMSTRIKGDPIWFYLSGPSGSGKTEILRILSGASVKQYTGFTAQALAGGFMTKDEEGGRKSNSLLSQLNNKTLVIRDASQIVSLPPDQFKKLFGILRDAFDGNTTQGYGTGTISIDCHLSIIAATTQAIEHTIEQTDKAFGERFLTFKPVLRGREEHLEHAIAMAGHSHHWRKELMNLTTEFMNDNKMPDTMESIECDLGDIIQISDFASAARTPVVRNKYRQDSVEAPPELEYGARLAKQLLKMKKAATWLGDNGDRIVKRAALSSIPIVRSEILRSVYENTFRTVEQLEADVKVSKRVIRAEADNLFHIGILKRSKMRTDAQGRPKYLYAADERWMHSLEIMYSDKWMGMSDDEELQAELAEDRRRRTETGRRVIVTASSAIGDFWPGM